MNARFLKMILASVVVLAAARFAAADKAAATTAAAPGFIPVPSAGVFMPPTFTADDLKTMRIRMKTTEGTIVFALDPVSAPKNAQQFAQIVYAGGYRHVPLSQAQAGVEIMVPGLEERPAGAKLPPLQLAALPLETGTLKHTRGVLSMMHAPFDKNSGRSAFFILLSAQPQMNADYSAFARMVEGEAVLHALEKKILDAYAKHKPTTGVEITSIDIVKKNVKKG